CQIGVFASYVSRHGHAFIDRALYLPKEWTDEPARLKAAHVPSDVGFATKPKIARQMIARAIAAKVPFSFVAADSVYGTGESETLLRKAGKGYVLGVASNHEFRSWDKPQPVAGTAAAIAQSLPKKAWRRLSSGGGTKGPRWHDWAYLELADLEAGEYNDDLAGEWTRGLLIRRNIADGSLAFFSTWCPKGTSIQKLVLVEGHRWAIEDSFETAKNEFGLDHNETRSWHGWHRHVSLVIRARLRASPVLLSVRWKAKRNSRPVAGRGLVIDHYPDAGPVLMHLCDFRRIGFARHRAVARFVVPDIVRPGASGHEVEFSFVPDLFSPVEQIAQHGFVCHSGTSLRVMQQLCLAAQVREERACFAKLVTRCCS